MRRLPISTLFSYPTLFRSGRLSRATALVTACHERRPRRDPAAPSQPQAFGRDPAVPQRHRARPHSEAGRESARVRNPAASTVAGTHWVRVPQALFHYTGWRALSKIFATNAHIAEPSGEGKGTARVGGRDRKSTRPELQS